ncbi:MAG: hypothetical protein ACR2JC_02560 [Chloroflexota bacterium]
MLAVALSLLPSSRVAPARSGGNTAQRSLTAGDARIGRTASAMAAHAPRTTLEWLRRKPAVRAVSLGRDGRTLDVLFRDHAELVILPPESHWQRPRPEIVYQQSVKQFADGPPAGRALVLEPFSQLLGHEASYGAAEAGTLSQAGFRVDVLRNQQVTVASLEKMAAYSVVYVETHSNVLDNGDVVIASGETDARAYPSLFEDGSITQVTVAGDPHKSLYLAIKTRFIEHHVGTFPDSSLLFINGCAVTNAPKFWSALQSHNVDTLTGWNNEVIAIDDETASTYVLQHLASGQTVAAAVAAASAAGLGTSFVDGMEAELGYVGDGENSLARALVEATPTPTPTDAITATPTPVATPTPRPVKKRVKCKKHGWHVVHGKCRRCKHGRCKKHR